MFRKEQGSIFYLSFISFFMIACENNQNDVILNAPDQIQVKSYSVDQIKISWRDRTAGESGYIVEKSDDNIIFTEIARIGADVEEYFDTNIQNGEYAYYRIAAYLRSEESERSDVSSVFHTVVNACAGVEHNVSLAYGKIQDLPIYGLNYQAGLNASVTDDNAGFYAPESEEVEFRIGYISLGKLSAVKNIGILNLLKTTSSENRKLNTLRLLIALDEDNIIENGIQLSCELSMASGDIFFDVSGANFDQQEDVLTLLAGRPLLTQAGAKNIYLSHLKKYYAGDYSVKYDHFVGGLYVVKGTFLFTLTDQGEMINQSYSGFSTYTIKETVFNLDKDNNLIIKISVNGQVLFQTARKIRMVANINSDRSISGWSKLYFLFSDDIGDVTGGLQ